MTTFAPFIVLLSLFLIVFIMILVPFIPGLRSTFKRKPSDPLTIPMDKSTHPRFSSAELRKEFRGNKKNQDKASLHRGDLIFSKKQTATKPIYATGAAKIHSASSLDALACDKNCSLGDFVKIASWIDVEKNLNIGNSCQLGESATCGKTMEISRGCQFKNLYAKPIITYSAPVSKKQEAPHFDISEKNWFFGEKQMIIPAKVCVNEPLISHKPLIIRQGALVRKSIKCHGDLVIEADVVIQGDVFAEGSIHVGPRCQFTGNLFSQKKIFLEEEVCVGSETRQKSVIGVAGVLLKNDTTIYGYVKTKGKGLIQ